MTLELAALIYPANIANSPFLCLIRRDQSCARQSDVDDPRERASLLFLFFSIMLIIRSDGREVAYIEKLTRQSMTDNIWRHKALVVMQI